MAWTSILVQLVQMTDCSRGAGALLGQQITTRCQLLEACRALNTHACASSTLQGRCPLHTHLCSHTHRYANLTRFQMNTGTYWCHTVEKQQLGFEPRHGVCRALLFTTTLMDRVG